MVVLAAGLPRCATSSLQVAFEEDLGLYPCLHMSHVTPHVDRLKTAYYCLLEEDKQKRQAMLHTLFDGYDSSSDFPGMMFVDDLIEMYPDVKIILNKRSCADAWVKSITRTLQYFGSSQYFATCYLWSTDHWHWKVHQATYRLVKKRYGEDSIFTKRSYERHNQWVKDVCKKYNKELLEWEPSMGYEPICKYLGKPVPIKRFPHANDEETVKKVIWFMKIRGFLSWATVLGAPVLATGFWLRWMT